MEYIPQRTLELKAHLEDKGCSFNKTWEGEVCVMNIEYKGEIIGEHRFITERAALAGAVAAGIIYFHDQGQL